MGEWQSFLEDLRRALLEATAAERSARIHAWRGDAETARLLRRRAEEARERVRELQSRCRTTAPETM